VNQRTLERGKCQSVFPNFSRAICLPAKRREHITHNFGPFDPDNPVFSVLYKNRKLQQVHKILNFIINRNSDSIFLLFYILSYWRVYILCVNTNFFTRKNIGFLRKVFVLFLYGAACMYYRTHRNI
jgi:hypothetical protein